MKEDQRDIGWYQGPGWRILIWILGCLGVLAAFGFLLPYLPMWMMNWLPYWVWGIRHNLFGLRIQDVVVVGLGIAVLVGGLGIVDGKGWWRLLYPILPGALFLWFCAVGAALRELPRPQAEWLREWGYFVERGMGGEVIAGVGGGLLGLGILIILFWGFRRRCPECGKWWGIILGVQALNSTTKTGSSYSESGWKRTRTTRVNACEDLRCRRCGHEWGRHFTYSRRYEKGMGPFSSWKRQR